MAGTFHGGVHPDDAKKLSGKCEVMEISLPSEVVLPVRQHIGAPAKVIVQKGDSVLKGQIIAESGGFVSSPVHATVSGTVTAVELRQSPLGAKVESIVIESNGKDEWAEGLNVRRDVSSMTPAEMLEIVKSAGIVGLGGAAFPTHVKLSPPKDKPIDTVILNGVECEPYATCDYRLMMERPEEVLEGLKIIMTILGCKKGYIGIELNKPDTIRKMKEVTNGIQDIKVGPLKVKYPQGGEKQLIYAVTGRKVPAGGLPMDVGCVVQNVGTAAAIYNAVVWNKPLLERVVTVTGDGVKRPANILARLGDSFARLVELSGGYSDNASKLIMGGPMMGIAQYTDEVPVIKGTSCILALEDKKATDSPESACISCGRCVEVCPMHLIPTSISQFVEYEMWDDVREYGALDCIECGCCTYICPAKRRIVERVKFGKGVLTRMRAQEQARLKAAETTK